MYRIRQMSPVDYPQIKKLWQSIPGLRLEKADSETGIAKYIARNPGLSFVAVVDEKIIGTVLCGEDGRRGYLQHLCVTEAYRGNGVGKTLLEAAIHEFQLLGLHEIRIFVFKNNLKGNQFWRDMGWVVRDDIHVHALDIS